MTATRRRAQKPVLRTRGKSLQYAALPWRMNKGVLQILMITTRNTRRWIIPKGWPIAGYTPQACAGYEALEEAGVAGEVASRKLGTFSYGKQHKSGAVSRCTVHVYAMEVMRRHRTWPEKGARDSRWSTPDEAVTLIKERGLRRLITTFAAKHRGRKKLKRK